MASSTVSALGVVVLTTTRNVPTWLSWLLIFLGIAIFAEFCGFHALRVAGNGAQSFVNSHASELQRVVMRFDKVEAELNENAVKIERAKLAGCFWLDRDGSLASFACRPGEQFIHDRRWAEASRFVDAAYEECDRVMSILIARGFGGNTDDGDLLDDAIARVHDGIRAVQTARGEALTSLARWGRGRRLVRA